MATAALALAVPKWRPGFGMVPHVVADGLSRGLDGIPYHIMSVLINETARPGGQWSWTRFNYDHYCDLVIATLSDVRKAFRMLSLPPEEGGYGLLEVRRVDGMKQWRFIPERLRTLPARSIRRIKKPVRSDISISGEQVEKTEPIVPKCEVIEITPLAENKTALHSDFAPSSLPDTGVGTESVNPSPDEPHPDPRKEFEDFCVLHLTPKLGTCPEESFVRRALNALGRAPLQLLKNHVLRRHASIKSWAMLPLLAEDVARAHLRFSIVQKQNPVQYDLTADWASAQHVRALHSAEDTPAAVKAEILLMWPELESRRKSSGDDFSERMIAVGKRQKEMAQKAKEKEKERSHAR